MNNASFLALQKRAVSRIPKLAPVLEKGFRSMDLVWGTKTPTVLDIVSTLTCLVNDLDPLNKNWLRADTGRLYAEYIEEDGVARIEFGMVVSDYVMKEIK